MHTSDIEILGYRIWGQDLSEVPFNNHLVINTLNGHSYSAAKKDSEFRQALLDSDILLPDGISLVIGVRVLNAQKIKKIAGYDLFAHLLHHLNMQNGSCFFLGSTNVTLLKIRDKIKLEFPNVNVGFYSPPFKANFTVDDSKLMCISINEFHPDVLFVGMTAPKQEKWVHENKNKLNARIICSIGAVFDFYAGTTKRPPKWMIHMKLEWLGRLLKEPKRMWKRYLISTPVFFIDILRYKFGYYI